MKEEVPLPVSPSPSFHDLCNFQDLSLKGNPIICSTKKKKLSKSENYFLLFSSFPSRKKEPK